MIVELTEQERDQMAHAIGHRSAKGCSVHGGRNHYCTAANNPLWCGLVERGYAVMFRSPLLPDGEATFHVTQPGREAVEADPRSQETRGRRRLYEVKFRQFNEPTNVWAETHGKARYAAVVHILDCFPDGTRQAFKSIESCRLA